MYGCDISGFPFREWLKSEQRLIEAIIALHSFKTITASGPVALDGSRWHSCLATSSSETVMSDSWEEGIKKEVESTGFMVVLAGRKTEQKQVLNSPAFSFGDFAVQLLKVIAGLREMWW
jgi:hypothetical protein